jgi:preprotein translocase subunit YajC
MLLKFLSMNFQALAQEAATTAAATTAAQPPAWMQFVPMLAIVVVFYFFLIRPQAKKQKEQMNFHASLKVGDQVVTQAGLLGKITGLNENIANLEISNGVVIKLLRSQITMLQSALQKPEAAK